MKISVFFGVVAIFIALGTIPAICGSLDDSSSVGFYLVKTGDCLSKIAIKFGVSVKDICQLNNIPFSKRDFILIGQKLKILLDKSSQDPSSRPQKPSPNPPYQPEELPPEPPPKPFYYYEFRSYPRGRTLGQLEGGSGQSIGLSFIGSD